MKYRPEIDGLRSVAVLPVILFHAGFSVFSGGFVGVDVFFVISGYLITSILVADLQQGRFSILRFYERRARRILPALIFVILCCIPFAWAWMVPSQLQDFGQAVVATAFFASNIHFLRQSGYFEPASEENVLLHTWSLAVEEQYYIVFPILLAVLWRFGWRAVLATIVTLALVSLAFSEWGWRRMPDANFYLPFSRAWELFTGSVCAFLQARLGQWRQNGLALAGLVLIFVAVFAFDKTVPFPSLYALVPVLGTALIILFAAPGTWVAQLLSLRVLVGVGLISYSAYLWHQPLFAFAHIRSVYPLETWHLLGLAAASLGLAWFSWRFVEQPFRGGGAWLLVRQGPLFLASGAALAVLTGWGLYLHLSRGAPDRAVAALTQPLIDTSFETTRSYRILRNPGLKEDRLAAYLEPGGPRLLVLGDSHGKDLFNALVLNLPTDSPAVVLSRNLPIDCAAEPTDASGADKYARCAARFAEDHPELFAATTHILYSMRWVAKADALDMVAGFLSGYAGTGKTQIVFSNTAEYVPQAPDLIRIAAHEAGYGPGGSFPKAATDQRFFEHLDPTVLAFNATLRRKVETEFDADFIDKLAAICDPDAQRCQSVTDSHQAIYYDYGHWTLEGAEYLGNRLLEAGEWSFLRPGSM